MIINNSYHLELCQKLMFCTIGSCKLSMFYKTGMQQVLFYDTVASCSNDNYYNL